MLLPIAIAQENFTVGDIDGNLARVLALAARAREQGAAMVVFPELALTGYPPEDLLFRPSLQPRIDAALARLAGTHG